MYSDQQLVVSLAILIAGFSQLNCDGIDTYHWVIMIYTAWFSSLTHLTTLSVLQWYFEERNRSARLPRLFFMFCTMGLVITALVPTAHESWWHSPNCSAYCFFDRSSVLAISAQATDLHVPAADADDILAVVMFRT